MKPTGIFQITFTSYCDEEQWEYFQKLVHRIAKKMRITDYEFENDVLFYQGSEILCSSYSGTKNRFFKYDLYTLNSIKFILSCMVQYKYFNTCFELDHSQSQETINSLIVLPD
jgi:hypothetical protein